MMDSQTLRQQLIGTISELPQKALLELLPFVDYLHYKFASQRAAILHSEISSKQPSVNPAETPLFQRLSPQELSQAFLAWVESHDPTIPGLSDDAVSRESMYEDEVL